MTPATRAYIAKSIMLDFTAEEVAFCACARFNVQGRIKASDVETIWNEECESNLILREIVNKLGDRPSKGWPKCEVTALAERLVLA